MSNTIILKNGTTTPDNTDLETAEPGFKKNTGTLYIGNGDKVVQINPIISSEEPERIPGALWIDTSIESSTEDSPLPISQGGTGANNAADALANLGAAPAGYGYGDAIPLIYISSDSGGVQTTAKIDEYFLALGNQMTRQISVCDPSSLGTGYVFKGELYRMNENEGTLEMYAADGTAVKRCKVSGVWGDWINVSPSAFAPAGYGYGGQSVALKNNSLIADEDDLDNELAKIYDAMNVGETKMITFFGYPSNSDWRFFGILSKSSASNGSLIAHSAYGAGSKIIKQKYVGTWQPTEWENPPMLFGVEYRTTERWNGAVVYCMAVDFGQLPASTYKAVTLSTTIARCIRYNLVNKYSSLMLTGHRNILVDAGGKNLQISTNADMSANQAWCGLWYTK